MAFKHPGTMMSPAMTFKLAEDSAKDPVRAKALQSMITKTPLAYKSKALEIVDIGYGGVGVGHKEFTEDGEIAYQAALLYWATLKIDYARLSMRIIQDWFSKNKVFRGDNAPLEAAWGTCSMARAAELIKYAKHDEIRQEWSKQEAHFNKWIDNVMMPVLKTPGVWKWSIVGNWHTSIMCARMQIAIFREDKAEFDWCVAKYKESLSKCIGCGHMCHISETKRDTCHMQMLLGGILQLPEMAKHQGVNLWDNRFKDIIEYHAKIMLKEVPEGIKKDEIRTFNNFWHEPVWEIGFAHFNHRLKMQLPKTEELLNKIRPERVTFHWGGGTLTHYKRA